MLQKLKNKDILVTKEGNFLKYLKTNALGKLEIEDEKGNTRELTKQDNIVDTIYTKDLIATAKQKYKAGDFFISATNKLDSFPQIVTQIIWASNYHGIKSEAGGVLYDLESDSWAELVNE